MLGGLLRSLKAPARPAADIAVPATAVPSAPAAEPAAPLPPAAAAPAADLLALAEQAMRRGDAAAALAAWRDHAGACPHDPEAAAMYGGQLVRHGRLDEAQSVLDTALRRFPASAPLLFNRAGVAQARMRVDEAIAFCRLALAAQPGLAMARFVLSTMLMLKGEYREAMLLFRARNELNAADPAAWPRNVPRWEGQPLAGKRLLVWLDWGGLGDELQFARYLAPLAREHRPARLVLGCTREGRRLYARIPGVDAALHEPGGELVDYQIPIIDLALFYPPSPQSIPPGAAYLRAPQAEVERFAARLAPRAGRRIGLCWSSGFWGKSTRSDKSVPLEQLAVLADLPDIRWVSLQKGPGRNELRCPGLAIDDLDADLNDLADTAALIENLDLVVSVDTAVAHLAGALGKPVIMLLKWDSGNFWLLEREDSPWYPSMRILRQRTAGDWSEVAGRLKALLAAPQAWPASAGNELER
jgi:tetratricopeptide (TPR) repeat protein